WEAMFLPDPEARDGPAELCTGLGLPGHRVPRLVGSHRVAADRRSPPSPGRRLRTGVPRGRTHLVVASPRGRSPIATARASGCEHRGGLGPQLRPRGSDGSRAPLVTWKCRHPPRIDYRYRYE